MGLTTSWSGATEQRLDGAVRRRPGGAADGAQGLTVGGAKVLTLGLAFKENRPYIRNTRVIDTVNRLREYGIEPMVTDPWVDPVEAKEEYGITLMDLDDAGMDGYDAVALPVGHRESSELAPRLQDLVGRGGVVYDVKGSERLQTADARL